MAPKKPFSIFRRGKNKRAYYYVQFRGRDGVLGTAMSTRQTTRAAAEAWALEQLQKQEPAENPTLSEFSEGFFAWTGHWALNKRSTGKRLSERQCRGKTAILQKTILPALGELRLREITRDHIDRFRNDLYTRGFAGNTINAALSVLRPILERAEDLKIIPAMPRIERAAINSKRKDIFTLEELRALFAVQWEDFRAYVMNMTAATSGIRRGELQSLQLQDVQGDFLHISKSWDEVSRCMSYGTKSGRARYVIIPKKVQHEIDRLIEINPWGRPDSFVFFSTLPDKPVESKIITRELYRAMHRIGITEDQRKARNLSFHSWRHLFNSILVNARIPAEKIRTITGHLTPEMTAHYYKLSADGYGDIRQVQEGLFGVE